MINVEALSSQIVFHGARAVVFLLHFKCKKLIKASFIFYPRRGAFYISQKHIVDGESFGARALR